MDIEGQMWRTASRIPKKWTEQESLLEHRQQLKLAIQRRRMALQKIHEQRQEELKKQEELKELKSEREQDGNHVRNDSVAMVTDTATQTTADSVIPHNPILAAGDMRRPCRCQSSEEYRGACPPHNDVGVQTDTLLTADRSTQHNTEAMDTSSDESVGRDQENDTMIQSGRADVVPHVLDDHRVVAENTGIASALVQQLQRVSANGSQLMQVINITNNNNSTTNYYGSSQALDVPGNPREWIIPYWKVQAIAERLDLNEGWKMLASRLKFDKIIDVVEQRAKNKGESPTTVMLKEWMDREARTASYDRLVDALNKMDRVDIVESMRDEEN